MFSYENKLIDIKMRALLIDYFTSNTKNFHWGALLCGGDQGECIG